MITFRCTKKTRDLLGLRDRDLSDETDGDLEEWFVDLATIDHRKCALFTHKVTLYSFWVPGVRVVDQVGFRDLFRHHLLTTLMQDGFEEHEMQRLFRDDGHRFAKTNSRSVLGSMRDHILNSRWYFKQDGGLANADVSAINARLNRTPMGALAPGLDLDYPINVLEGIIRPSGAA